jgi:hypothetical protein
MKAKPFDPGSQARPTNFERNRRHLILALTALIAFCWLFSWTNPGLSINPKWDIARWLPWTPYLGSVETGSGERF